MEEDHEVEATLSLKILAAAKEMIPHIATTVVLSELGGI